MIKAGIIGGSGYVAGELIRILVNHPEVDIDFIYSHSMSGQLSSEVHDDLIAYSDLVFTDQVNADVDVVFLCMGHGNSIKFLSNHQFSDQTKIIDLGNDFRLKDDAEYLNSPFIYGLIDANLEKIKKAQYIANPGCFATAIQLAILPLADSQLLNDDIHVNAVTGSTGAGKTPRETTHFSWRNNNVSMYKEFKHQHLGEISETIKGIQSSFDSSIEFLPVRGAFARGIFASAYTKSNLSENELIGIYRSYYKYSPFTIISEKNVHLKMVVNTNNCFLQIQKIDDKVLVTSVIDNLLKGASGQAVQNMNLLFGLDQSSGLIFKPSYF